MKKGYLIVFMQSVTVFVSAQPFASWTNTELKLNNGIVERLIQLPPDKGKFITTVYKPVKGDFYYFTDSSTDFRFEVNKKIYSGKNKWSLKNIERYSDSKRGDGAAVNLLSEDGKIELTVQFLLYPASPAIRKNLRIKNLAQQTIQLESVDVEKFYVTEYSSTTFSWVCHDYGRRRSLGPYDGTMQDALVIVHNSDWQQGIVIGNEASGVMKHTSVFWDERTIVSGLTHKDARFPFRKYINKGETFITPEVFTMVYNDHTDPDEILNTAVPEFVRKYMGIRLSELKEKPTFVYNTWIPFGQNINEQLTRELAKSAADAGMKEFIIDDGWQSNYGDWEIDKKKFPNGLKPIFGAPVHFANFQYTPKTGSPPVRMPAPATGTGGMITQWQVSNVVNRSLFEKKYELTKEIKDQLKWTTQSSEPSGTINLAKFIQSTDTGKTIIAKVIIESASGQVKELPFGFSDYVIVYFNGKAIYNGSDNFLSRDYRFLGTIGFFDKLFLPLKKGINELWFVLSEDFGGWGVKAKFENMEGISLK